MGFVTFTPTVCTPTHTLSPTIPVSVPLVRSSTSALPRHKPQQADKEGARETEGRGVNIQPKERSGLAPEGVCFRWDPSCGLERKESRRSNSNSKCEPRQASARSGPVSQSPIPSLLQPIEGWSTPGRLSSLQQKT